MSIAKENSKVTLRQAAQAVSDQWDWPDWTREDIPRISTVYSDLRTALAEPEQEPVAWMHPSRDPHLVSHSAYTYGSASNASFAAPVDIEALTKERDELMRLMSVRERQHHEREDVISNLRCDRDALMQAAKLALNTLEQGGMLHRVQAIAALKKAGV